MKRSVIKTVASCFALLCIIFIPFPFNITKLQLPVTDLIFGKLIGFISKNVFSITLNNSKVYSDTVAMYILVLLLFILAVVITVILLLNKKWQLYKSKVTAILYQFVVYYLALQLLKYGADKIFKNQFYIPEPNTLFTTVGNLEKDMLYWSAMGSSYSYNIFLGALEILAAVFILFKRTRLMGLLLSLGILVNVVAVNFGFNISVKLFSLLLLYLNIFLLLPYRKRLYQLLFLKLTVTPEAATTIVFKKTFLIFFMQWLATGVILLEVFYPFIRTGNFNGDTIQRPYLHGAYVVTKCIEGKDTLTAASSPVKRFFIHKDSYIIFQDQQEQMKDYKLQYGKTSTTFILTDYQFKQTRLAFNYQPGDSILTLQYFNNGKENKLVGKATDWRKLPVLKKEFYWTVDAER
jgi:hypothetical protein